MMHGRDESCFVMSSMHMVFMPDYRPRVAVEMPQEAQTTRMELSPQHRDQNACMHVEHAPYGIKRIHGHYQQPQLKS